MKQLYLLFILFLSVGFASLSGQPGTTIQMEFEDFMGRSTSQELLFVGYSMNSTNEYAGGSLSVFWESFSGEWIIANTNANQIFFESSAMTGANPPELASNTWIPVSSGYTLTKFSGTGAAAVTSPMSVEISALSDAGCNGAANGSMTAEVSGGTAPYTYAWSNGEITEETSATSSTIVDLAAGTYTVTVTDGEGDKTTVSGTVSQPTVLSLRISGLTNVACHGGASGSATAKATGGTPSYSFLWSNGAKSGTASNLSAGTYTVTVTDSHGCLGVTSVTVNEPPLLVASTEVSADVSCKGGSDGEAMAKADGGTPPYRYEWSNTTATTAAVTGLSAGDYTVTIIDANNCTSTVSASIGEPSEALVVSAVSQTDVSCNGELTGAAMVSASGGTAPYTYLWSTSATTTGITGVAAGEYSVTVTDANGCTGGYSFTITEPTALVASASVNANVSCHGEADGEVVVTATDGTPPYTYAWDKSEATTAGLTELVAGTYVATVTDANGCTTTAAVTVTQPEPLVVTSAGQTDILCNGDATGAAAVSVAGGTAPYTYEWSNESTEAGITGVPAGTYSVTVRDANDCSVMLSFTLTENPQLMASGQVDANVSCNGETDGAASVLVSGGTAPYTYRWSNDAATAVTTGLSAGEYSVTITDASGCTATAAVEVTEPGGLSVKLFSQTNLSCNGSGDGVATANVTGGTAPYTYRWSNGATTAIVDELAAGEYTLTVTDKNGCTGTTSATITEPTALIATVEVQSEAGCYGGSEGAASITVTGGAAPYTYRWSNEATTTSLTDLLAGTYTVTVTDATGCTVQATATISEASEIELTVATTEDSGAGDGSATVTATGGTAPYTYAWSTTETTASISELAADTYLVSVTDANGCTSMTTAQVKLTVVDGEDCANAVAIDSLLGGAVNEAFKTGLIDNAAFGSDTVFMDGRSVCFTEKDTLYHPVHFSFTGDGNTYRLRTSVPEGNNLLVDTRAVLLSGSCGELTLLDCNEDESDELENMMMEVTTEVGVVYTLVVDGATSVAGTYNLEVTQLTTTAITPVHLTPITVYPNPTADRITLTGITARSVTIFDGFGRRVATHTNPGTEVDMQQLPAGVYYLRVTDQRQEVYSARVVKQ